MLAFVLFDVFGCQFKTSDCQHLPLAFLEVVTRETKVDHDCRCVAGPGVQLDALPQLEHPVKQHPALLELLEVAGGAVCEEFVE